MNAPFSIHPTLAYKHTPLFPLGSDETPYRQIAAKDVQRANINGFSSILVETHPHRAKARRAPTV